MELIRNLPTRIINDKRESYAIFLCEYCQQEVIRQLSQGKRQKSCGCINLNIKHGESKTRLNRIWRLIKQRWNNPKNKDSSNYGGRGITICPEWAESHVIFRDWALNGYSDILTIDRKENEGNYEPSNCQWLTPKENLRKQK